jgi:hypothetical protein
MEPITLTDQQLNFVSELMQIAEQAVALRARMQALKARYDLNQFGATIGTERFAATPAVSHLDLNKVLLAMTAVNVLLDAFGTDSAGHVAAFHLMKG